MIDMRPRRTRLAPDRSLHRCDRLVGPAGSGEGERQVLANIAALGRDLCRPPPIENGIPDVPPALTQCGKTGERVH
jgi:hypothetical protein